MPILTIESGDEACGMAADALMPLHPRHGAPAPAGLSAWPHLSAGDPDEEDDFDEDEEDEDEDDFEEDEEEEEDFDEDEEFEEDEDEGETEE